MRPVINEAKNVARFFPIPNGRKGRFDDVAKFTTAVYYPRVPTVDMTLTTHPGTTARPYSHYKA